MSQDLFAHKAQEYEANAQRVAAVEGIGRSLLCPRCQRGIAMGAFILAEIMDHRG